MPAKKAKESAANRAARLTRVAAEVRDREVRVRINKIMKTDDKACAAIKNALISHGRWDNSDGGGAKGTPMKAAPQEPGGDEGDKDDEDEDAEDPEPDQWSDSETIPEGTPEILKGDIHRNHKTWRDVPPAVCTGAPFEKCEGR